MSDRHDSSFQERAAHSQKGKSAQARPRRGRLSLGIPAVALAVGLAASPGLPVGPSNAGDAPCGGKDRWAIKTGTDAGARSISVADAQRTTIEQLRALEAPAKRPQDLRGNTTETTVYSVTAYLIKYKLEDDRDYHLVLSDENGALMIAEVPNPPCIRGPSPFTAQIDAARQSVDANVKVTGKFPKIPTKIPVEVTGVGFFDKRGHGEGGPPNGIELHPVLQIEFPRGVPSRVAPARPVAGGVPAVRDGGLEGGGAAWSATSGIITNSSKRSPHGGTYYAWLGGYGKAHTDRLSQAISLPANESRITLSYWIAIDTQEKSSRGAFEQQEVFDTLRVEVRSAGGESEIIADFSNLEASDGYSQATADLSRYRGQTVTLIFTAVEDRSLRTSFLLDDISVDAE